ncbi:flagellar motor protein MotB [Sphingomonas sp. KR3-1]|uniref:flagellar motor protein MotB n=1 Tax=Sphingomonas sp. KR3-1 TaxID=3156611 RepID=UPI0032B5B5B4
MTTFDEDEPARPAWLVTLADLSLLLVGFFVFLQATQVDPGKLAAGIRAGFGASDAAPAPMPLDLATATGFAAGSALPGDTASALEWAHSAARDPRTRLRITGEVDGSAADVDSATGSGPILAADRARAVAALLIRARAIDPSRIVLSTGRGQRRAVLTLGFEGDRP